MVVGTGRAFPVKGKQPGVWIFFTQTGIADDLGCDLTKGDAVATVAQGVKNAGGIFFDSDVRKSIRTFTKRSGPSAFGSEREMGKKRMKTALQCASFSRQLSVPAACVREGLVFSPEENAVILGGAHVKIRSSGFPDETFVRPKFAWRKRLAGDDISRMQRNETFFEKGCFFITGG